MNNLLSTAQSAAVLFAQVTGARLTTNHDYHGECHSLTDEPWPTVAWADGSVTDFLPSEGWDGSWASTTAEESVTWEPSTTSCA